MFYDQIERQSLWEWISNCPLGSSRHQSFLHLQYSTIFPSDPTLAVYEGIRSCASQVGVGIVIVNEDRERYKNPRSWGGTWVLCGSNSLRNRVWKSKTENFLLKIVKLRMYIWISLERAGSRYTLKNGEMEEDTQWRNREHRKRGPIATSKVSAAITIANISPEDMLLLSCSRSSELSRLSNWDNMPWIEIILWGQDGSVDQQRKSGNPQIINGWNADPLHVSRRPPWVSWGFLEFVEFMTLTINLSTHSRAKAPAVQFAMHNTLKQTQRNASPLREQEVYIHRATRSQTVTPREPRTGHRLIYSTQVLVPTKENPSPSTTLLPKRKITSPEITHFILSRQHGSSNATHG